jgi:hypothetical protein
VSLGELLIEATGAWRRIASLACLLVAALVFTAPASANSAVAPKTEWVASMRLDWPDLDELERAARKCGATRLERHKDSSGEWINMGLAREGPNSEMPCILEWMEANTKTQSGPLMSPPVEKSTPPAGMNATEIAVEIAGWTGAALILLAYLLLSMGRLTGQSAVYQAMNLVGAAGFVVNGWWHGAMPSASLNVVWGLIGAFALWRILAKRKAAVEPTPPA